MGNDRDNPIVRNAPRTVRILGGAFAQATEVLGERAAQKGIELKKEQCSAGLALWALHYYGVIRPEDIQGETGQKSLTVDDFDLIFESICERQLKSKTLRTYRRRVVGVLANLDYITRKNKPPRIVLRSAGELDCARMIERMQGVLESYLDPLTRNEKYKFISLFEKVTEPESYLGFALPKSPDDHA